MNLKRSLALALTLVMLLGVAMPVAFGAESALPRIAGDNRYLTAVEVSQEGWDNATAVVLARGDDIADALAGVPLAANLNAPILLTPSNRLHDATAAEIARLNAHKVYILGGEGAISADVVEALEDLGLIVERIAGDNRFETAAEIAAMVAPEGAETVVLVNGLEWADALSAAPYAAAAGIPILTTGPKALSAAAEEALKDLEVEEIIVVGGPAVISDNVFNALTLRSPKRVFGSNRYGTGVALAEEFELNATHVYFASGLDASNGVDAIAGAVLAAQQGTGLFLVGNGLDSATANYLKNHNIMAATVFGGEGAVVPARVTQIANALVTAGGSGIAGWTDPGVEVTVAGKSVKAHATTGYYSITGIPTGLHTASYYLDGSLIKTQPVRVVKDAVSAVATISFGALDELSQPGIQVTGQIVDPNNANVTANAYLEVWDTDLGKWVDTGLKHEGFTGTYTINNTGSVVDFGDRVKVTISKTGFTGAFHTLTDEFALRIDGEVNLRLGKVMQPVKKTTISGKVLGHYGVPQTGLSVDFGYMVGATFNKINTFTSAESDKLGTFEFKDQTLTSRNYILKVIVPGGSDYATYTVPVSVTEGTDVVHNAQLVTGYNVNLTLGTDQVGQSFSGSGYQASLYKGDALVETVSPTGTPGTTLVFDWTRIANGSYTVKVVGPHVVDKTFAVTVSSQNANEVGRINVAGALTGYVEDEASALIEGATVELRKADGTVVATTETDDAGDYIFGGLPAGDTYYHIRVSYPGLEPYISWNSTDGGNKLQVAYSTTADFDDVTLAAPEKFGKVTGTIRTAGSLRLVDGATIYFHAIDVMNISVTPAVAYDYNEVVDDFAVTAGVYTATGLAPGFYRVVVRHPDNHENYVTTIRIAAGDDLKGVNYQMVEGGDATLAITCAVDDYEVTDAFGDVLKDAGDTPATLTGLSAGTYYVTRDADSAYSAVNQAITVGKGLPVTKTVTLSTRDLERTITLNLFDESYGPTSADKVLINGKEATVTTGTIALRPGTYTAQIYKAGYLVESVTITVKTTDGNFTLAPMNLTPWS